MDLSPRLVTLFWSKVRREPGPCWEWQGWKFRGYGKFDIGRTPDGRRRKVRAHRVAYALSHGSVPSGGETVVMHTCDNCACCNPAHLTLGTQAENLRDARQKGRHLGRRHFDTKRKVSA